MQNEKVLDGAAALVVTESTGGDYLPEVKDIDRAVEVYDKIRTEAVARLKEKIDFGVIPGTSKPSLLKPGAEKLCNFFSLSVESETIESTVDWEKEFALFRVRTTLRSKKNGQIVATGIGSCNSREKKYRTVVEKGGFPDIINTLEKMAQKRSHVDSTLRGTGLSDIYTQDTEDMPREALGGDGKPKSSDPDIEFEMPSKKDNGFCTFCSKKHGKVGDPVVKVNDKWGSKACYLKQKSDGNKPETKPETNGNGGPANDKQIAAIDRLMKKRGKGDQTWWGAIKEHYLKDLTGATAVKLLNWMASNEKDVAIPDEFLKISEDGGRDG